MLSVRHPTSEADLLCSIRAATRDLPSPLLHHRESYTLQTKLTPSPDEFRPPGTTLEENRCNPHVASTTNPPCKAPHGGGSWKAGFSGRGRRPASGLLPQMFPPKPSRMFAMVSGGSCFLSYRRSCRTCRSPRGRRSPCRLSPWGRRNPQGCRNIGDRRSARRRRR